MHALATDDRTLLRIAARFAAMAALAERAGAASFTVRWLVFFALLRAEAVGWTFAAGAAGEPPPAFPETQPIWIGPADMIALATRLRILAAVLCALLPPIPWHAFAGGTPDIGGEPRRGAPRRGQPTIPRRGSTENPPDTS